MATLPLVTVAVVNQFTAKNLPTKDFAMHILNHICYQWQMLVHIQMALNFSLHSNKHLGLMESMWSSEKLWMAFIQSKHLKASGHKVVHQGKEPSLKIVVN